MSGEVRTPGPHEAVPIHWAGEHLVLLPERAVWWDRGKTVFIADPHFGKASAFRFAGIPVPEPSHDADLLKLDRVIHRHRAGRLVILGDFLHAKTGRSEATFSALAAWRKMHSSLEIVLVLGNHDRHAGLPPAAWSIECVKEPWGCAPFQCRHTPAEKPAGYILSGHVHPAFGLNERIGTDMAAPCFLFGLRQAILPAFGNFTGTHRVRPGPGDRVFVTEANEVIDVSRLIKPRNRKPS